MSSKQFKNFEDLVRHVTNEVNTVLPVVSYKEVARQDWRNHLPRILRTSTGRSPDFVVCTHRDLVRVFVTIKGLIFY